MALGVYDMLTPDDLLRGRSVAGTGDIDTDGVVSSASVAGLREKVYSAESAGATIFLIPDASCGDVSGVSTAMQLVRVTALADAIESLEKLAADPEDPTVPRC
jgi:PDZ domain-containing protein